MLLLPHHPLFPLVNILIFCCSLAAPSAAARNPSTSGKNILKEAGIRVACPRTWAGLAGGNHHEMNNGREDRKRAGWKLGHHITWRASGRGRIHVDPENTTGSKNTDTIWGMGTCRHRQWGATTGYVATVAHSNKRKQSGKDSVIEGQPLLLFM
jgi:hypothetical protein